MPNLEITIGFPSDPCYLQVVRAVIAEMGKLAELTDKKIRLITLAVDEACANIIRHTYKNESHHVIKMTCRITSSALEVCLIDFGQPLDLNKIRHRELDDVRPGGLGTFFMKNIMDKIEYQNLDPTGNQVRLVKLLKPESSNRE